MRRGRGSHSRSRQGELALRVEVRRNQLRGALEVGQGLAGAALFPLGYDLGAFDGLWESRFGASVGAPRPGTKLKG